MEQILPLAAGGVTFLCMWLAGNKSPWAWLVGLGNQALWSAFIIQFRAWGLVPLTVALTWVYARNLRRWRREAADA